MDPSSTGDASARRDPDEVFCRTCGEPIHEQAEICPHCGVRNRDPPNSSLDSLLDDLTQGGNPFVAALASVLIPGLGQLYNREPKKGILIFAASVVAAFSFLALVGFVLYPAVWLYAIYDAYTVADRQSTDRDRSLDATSTSSSDDRSATPESAESSEESDSRNADER